MSSGIELARTFWRECVRPWLGAEAAVVGATLLGPGSEVLGFDDDVSTDHDFGPRLQLLVADPALVPSVRERLEPGLPDTFRGWDVRYATTADPTRRHRITVATVGAGFADLCGIDPTAPITTDRWLATPTARLAGVTTGAVFADPTGAIAHARRVLRWYPDSLWRYVLACQWRRLAQEEPFLRRAADIGDDLGSRLIAGRLARDLMRLAFLLEQQWAPYGKWLGTAFGRLQLAPVALPALDGLVTAPSGAQREQHYLDAASTFVAAQNRLDMAPPIDPTSRRFHQRDLHVLDAQRLADALIDDEALRTLGWRGAIDQWVDNTDALTA